jgi:hypothetical protein
MLKCLLNRGGVMNESKLIFPITIGSEYVTYVLYPYVRQNKKYIMISDEYMEMIKKEFEIQKETEDLNFNLPTTVQEIHNILRDFGINRTIQPSEVMFGRKHFGNRILINCDIVSKDLVFVSIPKLSEIIFDHYYPKPQTPDFFHFTTLDSALKILKSEQFRLYNLIKNYDFDEFKTFYADHNLDGYKTSHSPDGDLYEDHIMKQTFSLSLAKKSTLSPTQEDYMWEVFADEKKGVKLEFEVQTPHIDFRDILYKELTDLNKDLLINVLDKHFKDNYNRQFALSKISKIGGFYLPSTYDIENETRFLIKEHTDDYDFGFNITNESNDIAFIELPFSSDYGNFKIKAIHLGKDCDNQQAYEEFKKINLEKLIQNFA